MSTNTSYNVLVLNAGRRVELIRCFQKAAERLGIKSTIVGSDCSDLAPAIYIADEKTSLPNISSSNYVKAIIETSLIYGIKLIVPTIDTDLLLLAENKERIEEETGATLLLSDYDVVSICRDKSKTHNTLHRLGFSVPKMYSNNNEGISENEFPLFIKPRDGSSSINAYKVNNQRELEIYKYMVDDAIIQEYIEGEEFTVDIFLDFHGSVITIVPRHRIATRSGEISKGKVIKDGEIIKNIKRLTNAIKFIGHITVQLIKTQKGIFYIEINPRFGGGAPMSIQCGADSCENLYRLLMGNQLFYNENYRDNITFLRFDDSIALDENMEIVKW